LSSEPHGDLKGRLYPGELDLLEILLKCRREKGEEGEGGGKRVKEKGKDTEEADRKVALL